jgi:hypothetical protein
MSTPRSTPDGRGEKQRGWDWEASLCTDQEATLRTFRSSAHFEERNGRTEMDGA